MDGVKAPAARRRVLEMKIGHTYTTRQMRNLGLYADTLARAMKHGMVERVQTGIYRRLLAPDAPREEVTP